MNSLFKATSLVALLGAQALARDVPEGVTEYSICDPSQPSLWLHEYHSAQATVYSKMHACSSSCRSQTAKMIKDGRIGEADIDICCSYMEWNDGTKSCELRDGRKMIEQPANQTIDYSSSFSISTAEIKNPKSDVGGFDMSLSLVNDVLIVMSILDIF